MNFIGIDIGGTKISIGLFNGQKSLITKIKIQTDTTLDPDTFNNKIISAINFLLETTSVSKADIHGIGIGCPSTIDPKTGIINNTTNIPALSNFNLKSFYEKAFKCKVVVDNDANLAALAEHRQGAGIGFSNMVYCTASTGIGGGLILNNNIFHGSNGFAGEIGHCILTPNDGVMCSCGNQGCIESYASGAHLTKHIKRRIENGEKTIMTQMTDIDDIDGIILNKAYRQNDKMAIELLNQIGKHIGILLFNIYQILNVDCYVIGGGLMVGFGDELLNKIQNQFFSFNRVNNDPVYIYPAKLKEDFGIIGACEALF